MEFRKYMHVEKFGSDETAGIELGKCYVFPKLDGTNGSVWLENGKVKAGSRNRELTLENDNHGFFRSVSELHRYERFLEKNPDCILYGEFLIPHSLKTYREDAWREFYVFDIFDCKSNRYSDFTEWEYPLRHFGISYIHPLSTIENGTEEIFRKEVEKNTYLIKENSGIGEGVVIKNYDFFNKYGRQCWAKMVTNEFKDKHSAEMGPTEKKFADFTEQKICDRFITPALIEKTYSKILQENVNCSVDPPWNAKMIPRLFNTVFHDFVREEMWDIVKKFKSPVIDFNRLYKLCVLKIKEVKPELFTKRG